MNRGYLINNLRCWRIIIILLVMAEVSLVLVSPTFSTIKLILEETGLMGGFSHIRVLEQHPMWNNIWVRIKHLVLWVVINLLLVMVMVKVVWILGPPTFPPKKLIVILIVVILCHIRVEIINLWAIQIKTGLILCYLWGWMIILFFLFMLDMVLALGPLNFPRQA